MNVSELIQSIYGEQNQIDKDSPFADPTYNSGVSFHSNDNLLHDVIKTSIRQSYSIDPKIYDKYNKYGIQWNPKDAASGALDVRLAKAQSNWEKAWRALTQTVVSEIALGIPKGFADMADFITGQAFKSDNDYQNPVSKFLSDLQEDFKENQAIYQDPTKTGWSDWSDFGWWMNQVPSIVSSLTLLIPGTGVGKAVSGLGKLVGKGTRAVTGFTSKALRNANRANKAAVIPKVSKFENFINNPAVIKRANNILEGAGSGITQRFLENYQEGRDVYNQQMEDIMNSLAEMSPEEKAKLIDRNRVLFKDNNVDTNDDEQIARAIAKEAADKTFRYDMANLVFDIYQTMTLGNPLSIPKSLRATAKINRAQREKKILTRLGDTEGAKYLANRSAAKKTADWLGDHLKAHHIVTSELSEGVEEAINYIAQQEGINYGKLMFNPEEADITSPNDRLLSYFNNSELYESAFWGVLGGVMFQAGGRGLNRTYSNFVTTNKMLKNQEVKDGEKKKGFGDLWKQNWKITEEANRIEEINARIEDINELEKKRKTIYDKGLSPFESDLNNPIELKTLQSKEEKDAAWSRVVDEFITNMTFRAIDAGNYDLLREYLQDKDIREYFSELNDKNKSTPDIDIDKLIARMDDVERIYTDNLVVVNSLLSKLPRNERVPFEYVNIIARDNAKAIIKAQGLDSKIKYYEQSAEANKLRFDNSINDAFKDNTVDFKTATDLITSTLTLRELRNELKELASKEKEKATLNGQQKINVLKSQINTVRRYIKNITPALTNYQGDNDVFSFINSLFAEYHSDDSASEEHAAMLNALTTKNIDYLDERTGNEFEFSDEQIIKMFGDKDAASGIFGVYNQQLMNVFGTPTNTKDVLSKFEQAAPNLLNDYRQLSALNLAKVLELSTVANTRDSINTAIQEKHNDMNRARALAIQESTNTIIDLAKKYGRREMNDYIFNNNDIANISDEDKDLLDKAITVLDLTNPGNKKLSDALWNVVLLGDYQKAVDDAKERKKSSKSEKSDTDIENEKLKDNSKTDKKDKRKPKTPKKEEIKDEKPFETEPKNPYEDNTPAPETQPTTGDKITISLDIDKGVDFSFDNEDKQNSYPYIEMKVNDGEGNIVDGYEILLDEATLSQDEVRKFAKISKLFDGYDANNSSNIRIKENPVVMSDGKGHIILQSKGVVEYKTDARTSEEEEIKQQILSTGDEDSNPEEILDNIFDDTQDEDYELSEEQIRLSKQKEENAARAKEISDKIFFELIDLVRTSKQNNIPLEEINKLVDEKATELRQQYDANAEFSSIINSSIELIKQKYDLVSVAAATNNVIKFSTIYDEEGTNYEDLVAAINELLVEYNKVMEANGDTILHNGKYYINFEEFIRNINVMYNGMYAGTDMYNKLKSYFASDANKNVVITDNLDDESILERIKMSAEESLAQKLGTLSSYRVNIDELFGDEEHKPSEQFLKAFDNLKVGQTLKVVRNKNRYNFYSEDVLVGSISIPDTTDDRNGYQVINKGWTTYVYKDGRRSSFREMLSQLPNNNELSDKIYSYLYDNLDKDAKDKVIKEAYNIIINEAGSFINLNDNYTEKDVVDFLANIWRYKMSAVDFSKDASERATRADKYIDQFLEKLYNTYDAITSLEKDYVDGTLEIKVSNINEGELIRIVDETNVDLTNSKKLRDNYKDFTPSNEAFAKPNEVKLGLVTKNSKLVLSSGEQLDHDKLGSRGTPHFIIPNRNGYPSFVIGTTIEMGDTKLENSDAAKVITAARNYLNQAIKDYIDNPNSTNYEKLVIRLNDLFDKKISTASLLYGVSITRDKDSILLEGATKIKIYNPATNAVKFDYTDRGILVSDVSLSHNATTFKNVLNNLFNASKFNIDFKYVEGRWNRENGLAGYNKNGKFEILIPGMDKPLIYDSIDQAIIKGGFARVNTQIEKGSNYRRKGKNQGANQILEVTFERKSTTPVEKNYTGSQSNDTTQKQSIVQQVEDLLINNNDENTVDKIVSLVLPNLSDSNKKSLQDLHLLPKSITFAEEIKDEDGNVVTDANASINTSTNEVTVSRNWLGMLGRDSKAALRRLIHEEVHARLAEQDKDKVLSQIRNIYNEFRDAVNKMSDEDKANFSRFLFDDKKKEEDRLEEFLVESFTSKILTEKLNQIETSYEGIKVDESKIKKETLWDKILKLIAKIFNYDFVTKDNKVRLDKKNLLQKELYALSGALEYESKVEDNIFEGEDFSEFGFMNLGEDNTTSDGNIVQYSTIDETIPNKYKEEMQEIKDKAIANGTFMKAPNGNPTNLTERQWLQVRTKAFKDWFGDWENPTIFTANNVDNVEALQQKYPSKLPNKFYHHSTNKFGKQVFDSREGNKEKLHITGRLTTDKVDVLVVENPNSENKISHITLATAEGVKPFESNKELENNQDKIQPLDDYVDTTFTNNLRSDVSKVVDENGEPLVVYHATTENFNIFNPNHKRRYDEEIINRYGKNGLFFDKSESKARDWVGYEEEIGDDPSIISMPVFLNIKNPDLTTGYNEFSKRLNIIENPDGIFVTELEDNIYGRHKENFIPINPKLTATRFFDGYKFARKTGEFVVFDPNQIKSATDNIGTFSRENNDIRYSTIDETIQTHSSIDEFMSHIEPEKQAQIAKLIDNGELNYKCK